MRLEDNRLAIVISEDHYNALGMVRSLGEQKMPVVLILTTDSKKTFVDSSKYVSQVKKVKHEEESIMSAIMSSIKVEMNVFLFPLSDYAAEIIDKNRCSFGKNVLAPHLNGLMKDYQNKAYAKQYAQKVGIRVPQSVVFEKTAINNEWSVFPAIIKPLASVEGAKGDIVTVNKRSELLSQIELFWEKGYTHVLVEEFVTGCDEHMIEVMGYSNGNIVHVVGIIQKIREYPISNGSTSYAKIIDKHQDIELELIKSFIKEARFCGIFDMEFKYANGKAYFIECNFRNGAPGYVFSSIGKNLPVRWIKLSEDEGYEEDSRPIKKEYYFMCEQNDFLNMLKGNVNIFRWIKEYVSAKKIFFNWKDVRPVYKYFVYMLALFLKKDKRGR